MMLYAPYAARKTASQRISLSGHAALLRDVGYVGHKNLSADSIFIQVFKELCLVQLEGETSNSLFDTLADWNSYLKAENVELPKLQDQPRLPTRRGPRL